MTLYNLSIRGDTQTDFLTANVTMMLCLNPPPPYSKCMDKSRINRYKQGFLVYVTDSSIFQSSLSQGCFEKQYSCTGMFV